MCKLTPVSISADDIHLCQLGWEPFNVSVALGVLGVFGGKVSDSPGAAEGVMLEFVSERRLGVAQEDEIAFPHPGVLEGPVFSVHHPFLHRSRGMETLRE